MSLDVLILAAGKGTRMKSELPKVLHRVAGRPMIEYVLDTAATLSPRSLAVVIGHQAETLRARLAHRNGLLFVVQEPQLGTAHALLCAEPILGGKTGDLLVLSGDVPLLSRETLENLVHRHLASHSALTMLTAVVEDPHGYGRIVRDGEQIARIVEQKDATVSERAIREVNAGIYMFSLDGLFEAVRAIKADNAQREYYLPDLVDVYRAKGRRIEALTVANSAEIKGINSRVELAEVSRTVRQVKNTALMTAGVTLEDPATAYIDPDVEIGPDTIVHPNVAIEGRTTIGAGCEIHSGARIVNSRLGDRVTVLNHCVIADVSIDNDVSVGPFAHLRGGATIASGARIGNFVELKKTVLGTGSKAMHLAYLGDAVIGREVNVGAGTITCNYDGVQKHTTTIEDGAFIGSDTQLIAPVTIGKDAYVGTGTTVREDVPAGALAVSAGKQRNIDGWVLERRNKGKE